MTQRTERIAGEIRNVVGRMLSRGEIKDPRVSAAGIVTFTHVRVTGDLRSARVFFTAHDADEAALERIRQGLGSASGYIQRAVARALRMKVTPLISFEIDRVFAQEAKIDALLREIASEKEP